MNDSFQESGLNGAMRMRGIGITVAAMLAAVWPAPRAWSATPGWHLDFNSGYQTIVPSESVLTNLGGTQGVDRIDQICTGGRKWSLADPAGGSNLALRVFQSGDASCLTGASSKPKHRAHFHPTKATFNYPYEIDEHHWIGYRIWFPAEFAGSWSWLHQNGTEVAHWSYQGENRIRIVADQNGPAYKIANGYSTKARPDIYPRDQVQTMALPTGRWVNVVHHVLRKRDATGVIELWIDGVKQVNWHGIRTASDSDAIGQSGDGRNSARWKIGLYWGPIDRPVDFMIYLDDMKHARGEDGYALVDPDR